MSGSEKGPERRRAPRMSLDAAAVIRFDSVGADVRSRIVNLSRNGVLLAMPAPRPVGTRIHVTVRIGEPVLELRLSGIVVHVAEKADAPEGFTTHVGIFLTEAGPQWDTFCAQIAEGLKP